jgi:kynureninase
MESEFHLKQAAYRHRFFVSNPDLVYLDGNSLGRLPVETIQRIEAVVKDQWGTGLIRSWNSEWLQLLKRVNSKFERLLGAKAEEVLVCDSTSINLYKLVNAVLQRSHQGGLVVTDDANFPSDLYILQGLTQNVGSKFELKCLPVSEIDPSLIEQRVLDAIDSQTRLVVLSHVHYQSGYAYRMATINRAAARVGAKVIWDVSHSVGAMPIDVVAMECELMVGCSYKYLNGGPGAPAFLYVKRDLQLELSNPIQGWFGAAKPFEFSGDYQANAGVQKFAVGTPPILSVAAIEPGIDLVLEAGIEQIRSRSLLLTDRLLASLKPLSEEFDFRIATPSDYEHRGSHISIEHSHGWQITQALIDRFQVIPDFRQPKIIRFGITPLYTTVEEIDRAAEALELILRDRLYLSYRDAAMGVT